MTASVVSLRVLLSVVTVTGFTARAAVPSVVTVVSLNVLLSVVLSVVSVSVVSLLLLLSLMTVSVVSQVLLLSLLCRRSG